jgi:hypothetical protein
MPERAADAVLIAGGALAATAGIVAWHNDPVLISALCAFVLAALWTRFHESRDAAGLLIGLTLGNAVELACDLAGVWRHADRTVLGIAPAYILICYPILGLAVPRLVDAMAGRERPTAEKPDAIAAISLLLLLVSLSVRFHRDSLEQGVICLVLFAITLWRFHSRHDRITAVTGLGIGLVWEVPATLAGAWRFPVPHLFGLIPVWLPVAYAIFFVTIGRITAAASTAMPSRTSDPPNTAYPVGSHSGSPNSHGAP